MQYKYILDTSSKKFRCRKCNKNTLVKFIDTETGEFMPDNFGRCDRQSSCGFFEIPKGKLNNTFEYKHVKQPETSFHNYDLVIGSGQNFKNNNFIQFIKSLFGEEATKEVIKKYLIGTSKLWQGANVFWQIDNNEKVRHGKIMLYDSVTGKRQKNNRGKAYISSVRSTLKLIDFTLKQCLFGLHLINETKSKTVAIVESEKTAVIMSLFKPEYLWMATGSKSGFKYEYLKELRDYKIIGFPDKSEYNDWQNKAIELTSLGFTIQISSWLENTEYKEGSDLADVFIDEKLYNSLEPKKIDNKDEVQKINLIKTSTEIMVEKLALKNSNILKLIDVFELTDFNGMNIRL